MVIKLEEINWINGLWRDENANIIHPEPIGLPKSVELDISSEKYNKLKLRTLIKNPRGERLGYSLEAKTIEDKHKTTAVQFYKI
jgi:hypothetical protein